MTSIDAVPDRLIIAIGGNAIHPEGIRGTAEEQEQLAAETGAALLPLMELGSQLIITHGNGPVVGKMLLRHLARVAVAEDCARFEWSVLDWNEPAIRFYRSLGATGMDGWTVQRLDGEALHALAARDAL